MRAFLGLLLLTACSSGLKYSVDDNALANISVGERKSVLDAQNEINQAKAEQQKADSDLNQLDSQTSMAEKEQAQAKLESEKAAEAQKLAEQSHDINQMNTANRNKEVSLAWMKAAEAKLEWMRQKQKAAKRAKQAADRHVVASQAKYEVEKARLAQQKGIKPSAGFDASKFEAQNQEAQNDWQAAKNDADRAASEANDFEKNWKDADKRWQDMKGGK